MKKKQEDERDALLSAISQQRRQLEGACEAPITMQRGAFVSPYKK
jgi:hypothetical protein